MHIVRTGLFFLIVLFAESIKATLSPDGENVCLITEQYSEITRETFRKPETQMVTEKCWNIFKWFRCNKKVIKWILYTEPRITIRSRIVPKCCDGYKEDSGYKTKCLPVCIKECGNGTCTAPDICSCDPGFYGARCQQECPQGFWGENCVNKCDCSNNGNCDKVSGGCECQTGWMGDRCEHPCQDKYYGDLCKMKCDCGDLLCNHITGECITTTTTPTGMSDLTTSTTLVDFTTALKFSYSTGKSESIDAPPTISDEIGATLSEISAINTTDVWDATKFRKYTLEEIGTAELNSSKTEMAKHFSKATTPLTVTREDPAINEMEIKGIHAEQNFRENLDTFVEDFAYGKTDREIFEIETSGDVSDSSPDIPDMIFNTVNKTTLTNFKEGQFNTDEAEMDNFITEKKGSLNGKTIFTKYHFLPSFFVISGVSLLIFIIGVQWACIKCRRKIKKMTSAVLREEEMLKMEEKQREFQVKNFFWVNTRKENSFYCIDMNLTNTTPILETFKPLPAKEKPESKG